MISELGKKKGIVFNLIDKAMLIVDSPGPASGEAMFQRFEFPYPLVGHPFNLSD